MTHDELKAVLSYSPETGMFQHLVQKTSRRVGVHAGTRGSGYIGIKIQGKRYYAHRLAWFYVHGAWPTGQIDHINGDRQDNRIANLRDVSASTNLCNTHKVRRNSRSGVVGAQMNRRWFYSRIVVDGKRIHLGSFPTAEDASRAYLAAKQRFHHKTL